MEKGGHLYVGPTPGGMRPAEVDSLRADPTKARRELGWQAETPFAELVRIMVEADPAAQEAGSGRRRGGPDTR